MTDDEPIAIYREIRLEGKRVFELFPDRIRVRDGIQLRPEFDTFTFLALLELGWASVSRQRLGVRRCIRRFSRTGSQSGAAAPPSKTQALRPHVFEFVNTT